VRDHPTSTEYQSFLAACHNNIAAVLSAMGQLAAALESHRQALTIT
jgi:hypothetical protein